MAYKIVTLFAVILLVAGLVTATGLLADAKDWQSESGIRSAATGFGILNVFKAKKAQTIQPSPPPTNPQFESAPITAPEGTVTPLNNCQVIILNPSPNPSFPQPGDSPPPFANTGAATWGPWYESVSSPNSNPHNMFLEVNNYTVNGNWICAVNGYNSCVAKESLHRDQVFAYLNGLPEDASVSFFYDYYSLGHTGSCSYPITHYITNPLYEGPHQEWVDQNIICCNV